MPDQQQYISQPICTQLLKALLVIFALGVLVALAGVSGHDFSLVVAGFGFAVCFPMAAVHWVVEPAWPDSGIVVCAGHSATHFPVIRGFSRPIAPAAPPPRQFFVS